MSQAGNTPHVFLSYSREDRDFAAVLAQALQNQGIKVWWDVDIPAGVHYPKFIEEGLKSAASVVVLWSRHSTASRWVRNEADWGAENGTLVPLLIDAIEIPWEFRNFQTLSLADWMGDEDDPTFRKLLTGLLRRLDDPTGVSEDHRLEPTARTAGSQTGKRESPTRRLLKRLVSPALLLLAVLAVFLMKEMFWSGGNPPPDPPVPFYFQALTGDGKTHSSSISPDGEYLVYTKLEDDRTSLRLKQIDTGSDNILLEGERHGIKSPLFSPQGVYIYFVMKTNDPNAPETSQFNLFRISMIGGDPLLVAPGIIDRRFDVSPEGDKLVFKRFAGDSTEVWLGNSDGSGESMLAREWRDNRFLHCLAWSFDGSEIFTSSRDSVGGSIDLIAYPVAGGTPRKLPGEQWQAVMDIRQLPDGSELLVLGKPVSTQGLFTNLWSLAPGDDGFRPVTNEMAIYYQVTTDKSGKNISLNYYDVKRTLRVIDMATGGEFRDISTDLVTNGRVVWSGNDHVLVNQGVSGRVGLVMVDITSGSIRNIPTDVDYVAGMDLSTDGARLAYSSYTATTRSIYLANGDGSAPENLTPRGAVESHPVFSPGANGLVFSHQEKKGSLSYLWQRSLEDGSVTSLSDTPGSGPAVSPNGTRIAAAFRHPESGKDLLGTIPSAGGTPHFEFLPRGHDFVCWNPESTGFTTCSREGGRLVVWDIPLDSGQPRRLTDFAAGRIRITDASWSPDGKQLAVCLQDVDYNAVLINRSQVSRD